MKEGSMRLTSPAHDFKAIWQAQVGDRPVGHRRFTLAVMCLGVAMLLISSPVRGQAPQRRCARIGQQWVDFWNNQDVATAFDVFTEDIMYEDITLGLHASGADEFQAFARGVFAGFPISSFELGQSACQGQQGFFEWTWSAEDGRVDTPGSGFCGTGESFTVRGVTFIEIQGNRISHNADFWDLATVLKQLLPEGQECVARLVGLGEE
jgi:steroid delta-isomerase-like uncharacterized protein